MENRHQHNVEESDHHSAQDQFVHIWITRDTRQKAKAISAQMGIPTYKLIARLVEDEFRKL